MTQYAPATSTTPPASPGSAPRIRLATEPTVACSISICWLSATADMTRPLSRPSAAKALISGTEARVSWKRWVTLA